MTVRMLTVVVATFLFVGCFQTQIKLMRDGADPLHEFVIEGKGEQKIALIRLGGMITDQPERGFMGTMPSVVQEVTAQLALAEKDPQVKGVLLVVDTPGGTATASDMLYHEILRFKERTGKKVVVSMVNMATSGGYMVSIAADYLMAHPSTVTGSVGVITIRPKIHGLMDKIGVGVEVDKSGAAKDIGSPFNPATPEEKAFFQKIVDELAADFISKVKEHRKLTPEAEKEVATAAMFLPAKAKALGLIDDIGYFDAAVKKLKELSGAGADAQVVVYRREPYANDNYYNNASASADLVRMPQLISISLGGAQSLPAGFYLLCPFFSAE